jgi:pyruvate/2-oxoglutarate/acetoin dehydrogenase E1 component
MSELTMVEAINLGLHEAMEADSDVVMLGEDVGVNGGVFRVTAGLLDKFGSDRVVDTPISEAGFTGAAVGMALYGLKPIVEYQFDSYSYPAFQQIAQHVARYRWRCGGHVEMPIVLRIPFGGGVGAPEAHTDSPEMLFAHLPGLKVVCPSTPADARDMLVAAIQEPDPVVYMEPKRLYRAGRAELAPSNGKVTETGEVKARTARAGDDVTVISYGAMVPLCLQAADELESEDISAEVIDLRSLYPLDRDTLVESASRTGRVVIVHEAPRFGGLGAEVAAVIQEHAILDLHAPIERVGGLEVPFPYAKNEDDYLPSSDRVVAAVHRVLDF